MRVGKWFRGPENCFVERYGTKQSSKKHEVFQRVGSCARSRWALPDFHAPEHVVPKGRVRLPPAADIERNLQKVGVGPKADANHYSITSSARACHACGTLMPSALGCAGGPKVVRPSIRATRNPAVSLTLQQTDRRLCPPHRRIDVQNFVSHGIANQVNKTVPPCSVFHVRVRRITKIVD
jgi:hypothetical protein